MTKIIDPETLKQVLAHYACTLENSTVSPLGNGLINNTLLVNNKNGQFVLQRLNKNVFKKPQQVIDNAELINKHLLAKKQMGQYALSPIWQIPTVKDQAMFIDGHNEYWRALCYIPNCFTVEEVATTEQATQVATAFAQFTAALSDFPTTSLEEIIPDFHSLSVRMEQLKAAVKADKISRLRLCQPLVDFCFAQQAFVNEVSQLTEKLPTHVTHNDTKINNLLFCNTSNTPLAVIDLDTCMPGYLMHDFGDMVRTCCSNITEDATDLNNMKIEFDIYDALIKGYIEAFGDKISPLEQHSLVIGAQLLPLMIGVRFLTDYLDGDNYFHIEHDNHNLDRAKNQLNFFRLLHENRERLTEDIINVAAY